MSEKIRKAVDLENEEVDADFCRWAFGHESDSPVFFDGKDLVDAWNKLHKDTYTLSYDGNPAEDLAFMEKIWQIEGYPDGVHK